MREISVRPTDVLDTDRIIEMAWEDRTPFDAIRVQFGLSQGEVEKLMRRAKAGLVGRGRQTPLQGGSGNVAV